MFRASELLDRKVTEYPMLIEGLLPKCGLTAISGPSDTGKSCFLRDMALSIVEGKEEFIGQQIKAEHKSVLYVSTEDDDTSIAYLLYKQLGDVDSETYERLHFIFEPDNLLKNLEAMLKENPVDLIAIDAYTDIFTGSLNASNDVRSFLNGYLKLCKEYNCCILFLTHNGKGRSEEHASKHSVLGSQGFEAKMRCVLMLLKDKDSGLRQLSIVKGNYISEEDKARTFILRFEENLRFTCMERKSAKVAVYNKAEEDAELLDLIIYYKEEEQMNFDQITTEVNKSGYKVGRSKVHKMYQDYQNSKH